ncbi:VWA domain-containing protein [Oricola thermophila]|uniref:VWA domain-containing protein n=1 Tax=Oricola thermophila TaxID=2742145 RepID=A0A6N1VG20_9HYPH|nr:VWA domain-containing protein [Oricola thermophila]QKV18089.1 VWA domain-containing protein [Oricola thermophila]
MSRDALVDRKSSRKEIASFLKAARNASAAGQSDGRIVLALDATMSRQPTWDLACSIQADMFESVAGLGNLSMQLVYFRGIGECRASKWVNSGAALAAVMSRIDCRGGHTQILKVLRHAAKEHARRRINALVFIGDAMEEKVDDLVQAAGELGMRGVPVFIFQEGGDPIAETAFREIARVTRGGWFRFDQASAAVLARLLKSIAVYATGGLKALERRNTREDRLLLAQISGGKDSDR